MIGNLGLLACLLLSSREVRCWQSKSKPIDRLNQKSIDNNDDERGNADKEEGGDEREGKGREWKGREERGGRDGGGILDSGCRLAVVVVYAHISMFLYLLLATTSLACLIALLGRPG